MRQSFQKHEPQTTEQYVSDLTRQLCRNLPRDKAEQIAQETAAHLEDQVDDLTGLGLTRAQAETEAVTGFGPVRTYAQTATAVAYGDRTSARWRLVARLGAANFMAFNVLYTLYPGNYERFWVMGAIAGGLLVPLLAFALRRPQPRALLALSAATLAAVGIGAGLRYVPNSGTRTIEIARYNSPTQSLHSGPGVVRADHSKQIDSIKGNARLMHEEATLLQQGVTAYETGGPVPVTLKQNGRFIVPKPYGTGLSVLGSDAVDTSAFKDYPYSSDFLGEHRDEINALPFHTVVTQQEAAKVWSENGMGWLTAKQRRVAYRDQEIATLERAAVAPLGFNWGAATYHVSQSLWLCTALVILDLLLAYFGRAVWISVRNRRRSQAA